MALPAVNIYAETADDFLWMNGNDGAQMCAIQAAVAAVLAGPRDAYETAGDVLALAAKQAGINLGESNLEVCDWCGRVHDTCYGGEYIDPDDMDDLVEEVGPRLREERFHYNHYCDLQCVRSHIHEGPGGDSVMPEEETTAPPPLWEVEDSGSEYYTYRITPAGYMLMDLGSPLLTPLGDEPARDGHGYNSSTPLDIHENEAAMERLLSNVPRLVELAEMVARGNTEFDRLEEIATSILDDIDLRGLAL